MLEIIKESRDLHTATLPSECCVLGPWCRRVTAVPDDDGQDAPKAPIRTDVLVVVADVNPDALRAALVGVRAPELLVIDRPKAAEPVKPEEPIDVILPVATARFVGRFRGDGCSPLCRLLDGPDRRRGLPLKCICGRYPL